MFTLSKRMEVSASHCLELPYQSKCTNVHGHNWIVTVDLCGEDLVNGMLMDFTLIKNAVMIPLDHQHVNEHVTQPTAENMAKWIAETVQRELDKYNPTACVDFVTVQESEGNSVCFTP